MTTESASLLERKTVLFSGIPRTHRAAFTEEGGTAPRRFSVLPHRPTHAPAETSPHPPCGRRLFVAFHQHFTQVKWVTRRSREWLTWLPWKNLMLPAESQGILQNRRGGGGRRNERHARWWEEGRETYIVLGPGDFGHGGVATRGPCLAPSSGISNGLSSLQIFRILNWWVFQD